MGVGDYDNYYNSPSYLRENTKHGAEIQIFLDGNKIYHRKYGNETIPTVRSYSDGMRIGCTFLSNEALDKIFKFHQEYTNRTEIEHQSGV